jgi:DNA repair exonuclease SbcCD nuclease subunit
MFDERDDLQGFLFIGDPHVANRAPGFRKDEFARTVLDKLTFAMNYARDNRLMPVLLGDLFDVAHNNANWIVAELLRLFEGGVFTVCGNHDRREDMLADHDSLSLLILSGRIKLLDEIGPWVGTMNGATVVLGGTPNHQFLPKSFDRASLPSDRPVFVFWVSHHNLNFPAFEHEKPVRCAEIPGIDVVVNGHIHRSLDDVVCGSTLWINPGNITRLSRTEAARQHVPGVLRIDVSGDGWKRERVTVPHQPFDDVFHPETNGPEIKLTESVFIKELAALQAARTESGAGLQSFLDANLPQFAQPVADEIRLLAKEVLSDATN